MRACTLGVMSSPATPSGTDTKSDIAYGLLRRAIVTGAIQANEPLDEATLTQRYGVGRTPYREALKRLAQEGFIVWPPRRSPFVRAVSAIEQTRLHEARLCLEVRTAELAAERATESQLDELDAIVASQAGHIEHGRVYEVVCGDHDIHYGIAVASQNRFLAEAVQVMYRSSMRLWHEALSQQGMEQVGRHHQGIIDALRAHDTRRVVDEVTTHIHESYDRQMRLLHLAG